MQNKSYNNFPTWKSKLEELESLPGEAMPDKNTAWEKLHARLEGKKPQRKAVWYWIAAACILFLFIVPLIVSDKKDHQLAHTKLKQNQSESKQNQDQQHAAVAIITHNKDSVTIKHSFLSGKGAAIVSNKSNQLVHKNILENKTEDIRIYDTVSNQSPMAVTLKKSLQVADTSSGIVSIIRTKKRLPVVHVNELDDAVDIPPLVARNSENASSHFLKLASQEVYKSSPVSVTKNFATINFKSSPN